MATQRNSRMTPELPAFYYHEHFSELLDFVEAHYAHALRREDREFLNAFRSLPHAAQCLYVRLVNRKGTVFGLARLDYAELGPPRPIVDELERAGFTAAPAACDFEALLNAMTRDALLRQLEPLLPGLPRSLRKPELARRAREAVGAEAFVAALDAHDWVAQRRVDAVGYLKFLFFGRVQQGMVRFTMRDLGIVRTRDPGDDYEPRFADRDEAVETWFFASRIARLRETGDAGVDALLAEVPRWPEPAFSGSARRADALAERLGRALERLGRDDEALVAYRRGESAACIERQVRVLLAAGRRDAVRDVLETCLDAPRSDEEWLFAHDLYARTFGGKRTSSLTDVLRSGETVEIDQAHSDRPERAVIDWYTRRGQEAWPAENALWRTLFGLAFWDLLFGPGASPRHSPFDALPAGLEAGTFFAAHEREIEALLERLREPGALLPRVVAAATRYYGAPNALFGWRPRTLDGVFALARHGAPAATVSVLRQLCLDFRGLHGFPDLLVRDDDGLRFVEVKTAGDQLRRNQLLRLEQLRAAGFRADVLRVSWFVDPEQPYVVVDVETTGGRGVHHRVTEVGAVRVVGDRIVDRFSSLVNPERRIPAAITRLTGISDAMVADAPRFADIADGLAEFLDGAIFVAHNVDFDYGFIGREFRRLGRPFRMPRLCTCASMRRLFPGHASYSLKALCADFDIELATHHRALCDAEAAAGLLLRINERRAAAPVATDTD